MEVFDVSVPIREGMITYPGDPQIKMERVVSIEEGGVANLTRLDFGVHTGTHVDAPLHFIDQGLGVDALPLEVFLGPCEVVDATDADGEIAADAVPDGVERVLFKTRNSELWDLAGFDESFVRIGLPAARRLVENRVRLVGIDYLSVGEPKTHETLLGDRRDRRARPARDRARPVQPGLPAAAHRRLGRRTRPSRADPRVTTTQSTEEVAASGAIALIDASGKSSAIAAWIKPTCENAWGKFPISSPL